MNPIRTDETASGRDGHGASQDLCASQIRQTRRPDVHPASRSVWSAGVFSAAVSKVLMPAWPQGWSSIAGVPKAAINRAHSKRFARFQVLFRAGSLWEVARKNLLTVPLKIEMRPLDTNDT